jgi:hypothetical protein
MAEPLYIPDRHRMATHILAVWDHLELMDLDPADLRDTPRGPCLAYYADVESIEDLVESAVPAPACVDAEVPTEVVLARYVAAAREQWLSVSRTRDVPNPAEEMRWLKTAVWTYRVLTDRWPILDVHISRRVRGGNVSVREICEETDRLFRLIKVELDQQLETRWWEDRLPKSA